MGHLSFYKILVRACFQQTTKTNPAALQVLMERCRGRTETPNETTGMAVVELSPLLYGLPFTNDAKTEALNFSTSRIADMVLNLVAARVRGGQLVVLVDDVSRLVSTRKRKLQEKRKIEREKEMRELKGMPDAYSVDTCALVADGIMRGGDLEKVNVRRLISCTAVRQTFNKYLCSRARAYSEEWKGSLILDLDFGHEQRQPCFVCVAQQHKSACDVLYAMSPSAHGEGEQVAVEWLRRMAQLPTLQHQTAVLRSKDQDALLLLLTQFPKLGSLNVYWQPEVNTYLCIRAIIEALEKNDADPDPAELAFAFIVMGCDYVQKNDCTDGYGADDVYAACKRAYPRHQKVVAYGELLTKLHTALRAVAKRKLKKMLVLPPTAILDDLAWTHEYYTHARDRDRDVVCIDV